MFSDMKPSEKRLLDACQKGEVLDFGNNRPKKKTDDNEIRGEFLRTLILSNNQKIEVDTEEFYLKINHKGIMFNGLYVSGNFDFTFCNTDLPFLFENSIFQREINISDSKIRILSLSGSKIYGLSAQRLSCGSDIFLRDSFESNGQVDFSSAQISGSLSCINGKIKSKNEYALNCNGAKINGSVFLCDGFKVKEEVNFISAKIGRNLVCSNGKFINKNKIALNFDSTKINGNVLFAEKICVTGDLNFTASQIEKISISNEIRIKGNCFFSFMKVDTINITNINFNEKILIRKGFDKLFLDGLEYNHLSGINLDSKTLISWLGKMPEFKPQPYKQLAKILRNMGHHKEADDIMIEYNNIITNKSENWFIKKLKQIYGKTAGYGYKPMRVVFSMFTVWFLCSLFYWNASKVAVFAPTNPLVFQKKDCYQCNVNSNGTPLLDFFNYSKYNSSNNWVLNENLDGEYTTFNPFMYSLDVILPIVDLQVEKDWGQYVSLNNGTLNDFTRWLMWFEILFGWIYSLILVAILSGLAKNEKD